MSQARVDEAVAPQESPGGDPVREHTRLERLTEIDEQLARNVERHLGASDSELSRRIAELEHEWDMERVLEVNASILALVGLALAVVRDRRFAVLPVVVLSFLVHHAVRGWCPPVPLFRMLGVRTRQEIDAEKHALRALRGDYDGLRGARRAS